MDPRDAAAPDDAAPPSDAGPLDAGPLDMGALDMSPADAGPFDMSPADAGPPDQGPPDLGPPEACARWEAVDDAALLDALHADVQSTYRPIEPALDRGGNLNRYTTARHIMFTEVERFTPPGAESAGVECAYTGRFTPVPPDGEPDTRDINCEHSWPRSRMHPDREGVLYAHQQSDIHHLFPTDAGANSARGSLPYGEPVSDRVLDYLPAVLGRDAEGREVFQPREERRGDVARGIFYFSVRWGMDLPDHEEEVLRRWSAADPPDARERDRNDAIAAAQGNRNPFVDCPAVVERVPDFVAFPILDRGLPHP